MRYPLTLVRTAIIKKSTNNKCWRGCGEKGILLHLVKLVKSSWRIVQRFLKKLKIELPYDPVRRRQWHPTPVFLPEKSQGRRSLVGYSPWGRWGSDTTERLHFHFSLSCIGEGNSNPLQCSCLENPRDGASWWAAVYGFAQSRTWPKWLSSMI